MDGNEKTNPDQVAEVVDINAEQDKTVEDPRSPEALKARLKNLETARDQVFAQYHSLNGACQAIEQLLG